MTNSKPKSFGQTRREARNNKQLEFEWNGAMYPTRGYDESERQWLTSLLKPETKDEYYWHHGFWKPATRQIPDQENIAHNQQIYDRLKYLDMFTPVDDNGVSAKNYYLSELNQNLSPEYQLTMTDLDNWDPYGIKTKSWLSFANSPFNVQDYSMLNAEQAHNWLMNANNRQYPDNPYQLTMDQFAQWDPDGSKSRSIILGETPEGLHNLFGRNWLHYNLASALNDRLRTAEPEFSKLFQYDPASFSQYDPDGKLAADYLMYNRTPPEGSAIWDQARLAELNRWEQHFNAARNHPIRTEYRTAIPDEYQWTNEDSPSIAADILRSSYRDQGRNWQYYVDQDPLAKKYQLFTQLNPSDITAQEFNRGLKLSTGVPLTMLGAMYGGRALWNGYGWLNNATGQLINRPFQWGAKKLGQNIFGKAVSGLGNGIGQYGGIDLAIDAPFYYNLGKSTLSGDTSVGEFAATAAPTVAWLGRKPIWKGMKWVGKKFGPVIGIGAASTILGGSSWNNEEPNK